MISSLANSSANLPAMLRANSPTNLPNVKSAKKESPSGKSADEITRCEFARLKFCRNVYFLAAVDFVPFVFYFVSSGLFS